MPQFDPEFKQPVEILFLDNEEAASRSLRLALRKHRKRWFMRFSSNPTEALEMLEERPAEVVVSDMLMATMDGAEFLTEVKDRWPETLRFVMSGHADDNQALRVIPSAHQWLPKPTPRDVLIATVEKATGTARLLAGDSMQDIAKASSLLTPPTMYMELLGALQDPRRSVKDAASVIERDPAVTARVLQLTNSAFFGLPRALVDVRDAVAVLGMDTLVQVVLACEVVRSLDASSHIPQNVLQSSNQRANLVSKLASEVMGDPELGRSAMTAGILHDLGFALRLMLKRTQIPKPEILLREAHFAGALLGIWGLPLDVVYAVAHWAAPQDSEPEGMELCVAVHVARALIDECCPSARRPALELDLPLLNHLGLTEHLEDWRATAEEVVRTQFQRKAG